MRAIHTREEQCSCFFTSFTVSNRQLVPTTSHMIHFLLFIFSLMWLILSYVVSSSSHIFCLLALFLWIRSHWRYRRYNFLVFFVQARERKFFWEKGRCFGSLHWSSLKLVVSTFDLVLMEILIIGSSVVAFVRRDLWLVFPDLVLLSRLWVVHHSTPINEVFWVGVLLGSEIWVLLFSKYLVIICFSSCSLFCNGTVYG